MTAQLPSFQPVRPRRGALWLALMLALTLARCSSCQLEDRSASDDGDTRVNDDDSGTGTGSDDDDDDSTGTGDDDDDDSTGGDKACEWWDIPCLLEQGGNDDDSSGTGDDDDSTGTGDDDDDDSTGEDKECEWWDVPCLLAQGGDDDDDDDDDDSTGGGKKCTWPFDAIACATQGDDDDDDSTGTGDDDDDSSGTGGDDDDDDDDDSTGGKNCSWPFDADACAGGADDDDDDSTGTGDDDDDSSGTGGDDDDDDDDDSTGGKNCGWPFDVDACAGGADDDDDDSTGTGDDDDDSTGTGDDDDATGTGNDDDDDDDDDSTGGKNCGWPFDADACAGGADDDDSTGSGDDDDDDDTTGGEGVCGDGAVNPGESCDGDPVSCTTGDGYEGFQFCNADCSGYSICSSEQFCGDGEVNGEEACDDGAVCDGGAMDGQDCTGNPNLCKPAGNCAPTGSDECSENCFDITLCGNGVVNIEKGEECDDGEADNASGIYNCSPDCRSVVPEKWISPAIGRVTGAVAVGTWNNKPVVYAGSEDGNLYMLAGSRADPPTKEGEILWQHATGAPVRTHPTLGPTLKAPNARGAGTYTDRVYLGNSAGKLLSYGIKATTLPATGDIAQTTPATTILGGPAVGFNNFLYFAEGNTGQFSARNHAAASQRWFGYYYDHTSYSQPFAESQWTANLGGVVSGEPAVGTDGSVYFIVNLGTLSTLYSYWEGGRTPCNALDCNETHSADDHDVLDTAHTGGHSWKWWVYWNVPDDDCISPCNSAMRNDGTNASDPGPTWRQQYDEHGRNGKMKWERPVGRQIVSGPVFDGKGRLYFGTADGDIVALNESDGSTVWEYPLGTTCRPKQCEGDAICEGGICREPCGNICLNGSPCLFGTCSNLQPCVPRPCSNGGTCVADICQGGAAEACGDLDCFINTATPMVIDANGIMYFGAADTVRAIRILDGDGDPLAVPEPVWTFPTDGIVFASPTLGENGDYPVLYAGTVTGNFYALDTQLLPEDDAGKGPDEPKFLIWRYRTSGKIISAPSVGKDGTVYLATDRVIALEGATNSDGAKTAKLCTGCAWPKFGRDAANSGRALEQVCGNGNKEGSENCDDGMLNGTPDHCNAYCTGPLPAFCGNGDIETVNPVAEYCDSGKKWNGSPNNCDFDCTRYTPSVCGNGVREYCVDPDPSRCPKKDETCDHGVSGLLWENQYDSSQDGNLGGTNGLGNIPVSDYAKMEQNCYIQGSGWVCYYVRDYDTCNSQTGNGRCLADCSKVQACNDGIRDGTEWCDDGSSNDTSNHCNRFCNDFVPQDCGNDKTETTGPKMNPCGNHSKRDPESCDDGGWNGWPFACDSGCGSYIWR